MKAQNIDINRFIEILVSLQGNGTKLIDLDMVPDDRQPNMNKIVIHPVYGPGMAPMPKQRQEDPYEIRDPLISPDTDDIFYSFGL